MSEITRRDFINGTLVAAGTSMLPLEATSILGSLGGIGEIAKEVFGKDDGNPSTGQRTGTTPIVPPNPDGR